MNLHTLENSGNIGKNYRRHDEIGTPICLTVDFETLEESKEKIYQPNTSSNYGFDETESADDQSEDSDESAEVERSFTSLLYEHFLKSSSKEPNNNFRGQAVNKKITNRNRSSHENALYELRRIEKSIEDAQKKQMGSDEETNSYLEYSSSISDSHSWGLMNLSELQEIDDDHYLNEDVFVSQSDEDRF